MFKYDIRNAENAIETLAQFTEGRCSCSDDIWAFVDTYESESEPKDVCPDFINEYKPNLNIPLENIEICATHYTSTNDDGAFMHKYGLIDLKTVLCKKDSPLSLFLSQEGIAIDVEKAVLRFRNKEYDISYNRSANMGIYTDCKPKGVARKIYYDNGVTCFLHICDVSTYGAEVEKRPEFLSNLDCLLKTNLSEKWIKMAGRYRVDFSLPLCSFMDLTYCEENMTESWLDKLFCIALLIAKESLSGDCCRPEGIYGYVKPDVSIKQFNMEKL